LFLINPRKCACDRKRLDPDFAGESVGYGSGSREATEINPSPRKDAASQEIGLASRGSEHVDVLFAIASNQARCEICV
jgi:hypothetical protein